MHLPRRARNQLHIFIIRKARTPRLLKSLFILDAKSDIRFIPEMRFLNPIFKKQNENELLIFISTRFHIFMWRVWWKLENCFCFLWKQMFKMFKGAATDSLPGQFFPTGKTISLCLRWGFKMKVIVVTLYTKLLNSFEMLGKNTQKVPPSMLLDAWVFRKKQISDGDHHWEWCFAAAAVEISLSWIGRYPNMNRQSVKDILHCTMG